MSFSTQQVPRPQSFFPHLTTARPIYSNNFPITTMHRAFVIVTVFLLPELWLWLGVTLVCHHASPPSLLACPLYCQVYQVYPPLVPYVQCLCVEWWCGLVWRSHPHPHYKLHTCDSNTLSLTHKYTVVNGNTWRWLAEHLAYQLLITKMPRWSNAFITGNNKLPNLFLISTVHTLLRVPYATPTHHKVGNPPPLPIHGGRKWKSGSERAGEQRTWIRLGPYVSNSCHTNEVPSQLCIPVCHIRQMNYCQTLISLSS